MKIIYKNEIGGVSIITPTPEALKTMKITDIADKDVPKGTPYALVEDNEIPTDRTFRGAWVLDESTVWVGVGKGNDKGE